MNDLPIIPPLPEPPTTQPDGAIAICGLCGMRILPVMHYVCPQMRCPVFPKVTCCAPITVTCSTATKEGRKDEG